MEEPEGFFDGWSADLTGVDEQAVHPTRMQTRPNHRRTIIERPDFRMFLLNFGPTIQPPYKRAQVPLQATRTPVIPIHMKTNASSCEEGKSTYPEHIFRGRGILLFPPHFQRFRLNQIILVYLDIPCISIQISGLDSKGLNLAELYR